MHYQNTPQKAEARVAFVPLGELVDLARYPLDEPEVLERNVCSDVRAKLRRDGCAVIEGFVEPAHLEALAAEARRLAPAAHRTRSSMTCYGHAPDSSVSAKHPMGRPLARQNAFVPADAIPEDALLRRIYHDPRVKRYLARCLGVDAIHEFDDPYAALVVNVLEPGATHAWHFDSNDFAVSLMTQAPQAGGAFEYSPWLRRPDDERYDAVTRVLDGERDTVTRLNLKPGDLQLFHGRYSLHRVSPVEGERDRLMAIFAYADQPGLKGARDKSRLLFGRDN